MVLTDINKGEIASVIKIDGDERMIKRLHDMGLTLGVRVKVMSKNKHEAMVINVRGSRIVLGEDITNLITIDPSLCVECPMKTQHCHGRHRRKGRAKHE